MSLDGVDRPVPLVYPRGAGEYVARLRRASSYADRLEVVPYPVSDDGPMLTWGGLTLESAALEHRVPTVGYRLVEADGRSMVPELLAERGVAGPDVGRLLREGWLVTEQGRVDVAEVSRAAPGSGSRSSWTPPCATARGGWPSARTCSCARRRTPRPTASWPRRTGTSRPATPAGSPPAAMPGGWSSRTSPSATPTWRRCCRRRGAEHDDVVLARDLDRIPVPARERPVRRR